MPQTFGRIATPYEQDLHKENARIGFKNVPGFGTSRGFQPGTGYNELPTESDSLRNKLMESLERDPMEDAESQLPELFEHVNPGFRWSDRHNLIPGGPREQHWSKIQQQYYADFEKQSGKKIGRLAARLELIGKKPGLPWAEKLKRAGEMAEAKRVPKEPKNPKETKYETLTRERDETEWGTLRNIIDAWEVGEKTTTEDGEEGTIIAGKNGMPQLITKADVENAKSRFDEIDRKLSGRLPQFKRISQEGPFVRKRIAGRKAPKRSQSQIIRTGKDPQGRKVVQYMDGTLAYATD